MLLNMCQPGHDGPPALSCSGSGRDAERWAGGAVEAGRGAAGRRLGPRGGESAALRHPPPPPPPPPRTRGSLIWFLFILFYFLFLFLSRVRGDSFSPPSGERKRECIAPFGRGRLYAHGSRSRKYSPALHGKYPFPATRGWKPRRGRFVFGAEKS